jgi:hypothetical protein
MQNGTSSSRSSEFLKASVRRAAVAQTSARCHGGRLFKTNAWCGMGDSNVPKIEFTKTQVRVHGSWHGSRPEP